MEFSFGTNRNGRPSFVAAHDSATGMVQALADRLHGSAYEGVEAVPSSELYAKLVNSVPAALRRKFYSWSGKVPALPAKELAQTDASEIDRWICGLYPKKKYPAIALGSCNGAAVHLNAALGIPWLPQTLLVPVDKGSSFPVDEPKKTMQWAEEPAGSFLDRNRGWQLHHMMDPNQDRLRVGSVGYFRIKKLQLGSYYEEFIEERLEEGGRILLLDCNFSWPVHKVGERHYFQLGGLGGLSPREYYHGSEKVRSFLKSAGSRHEQWDAPPPTHEMPEAEWGLESVLAENIKAFTGSKNIQTSSISFTHPQALSAPVADLFRWWYAEREEPAGRLLVETFNLIAPYLSLKKRCVPYWLAFIDEGSAKDLEEYLRSGHFEEIYLMILSHGKNSAGSVPASQWESLMARAGEKSGFIGTDPAEYPLDLAVYARYSRDLQQKIKEDYLLPPSLQVRSALEQLQRFSRGNVQVQL